MCFNGKNVFKALTSNLDGTCPCWYGGGADHQQDHDHRDAFCAFRHDRDRPRRDRGCKKKYHQYTVPSPIVPTVMPRIRLR